ncbi:methyl-accepting chemotaxis protein [Priestia filamentosa]|uniref:methyl-accepting chemotaxis protein n=1 Tax=Priestia filamentosa TaxID=1402861 RepID=UPI0005893186
MDNRKYKSNLMIKMVLVITAIVLITGSVLGYIASSFAKKELTESGKERLYTLTHSAVAVANKTYIDHKQGISTLEFAQSIAQNLFLGPKGKDGKRDYSDSGFKFDKDGYVFAVNSKGVATVHPYLEGQDISNNKSVDGKEFIKELITASKKENKEDRFITYKWEYEKGKFENKIAYAEYFAPYDWVIISTANVDDFYAPIKSLDSIVITTVLIITASSVVLTIFLVRRPIRSIKKLTTVSKQLGEGNLNIEEVKHHAPDEIGQLVDNINVMKKNLEDIIVDVNSSSHQVSAFSEELSASIEENSAFTSEIANSIQKLSNAAEVNKIKTVENIHSINEVLGQIQEMVVKTITVSENATATTEKARNGYNKIETSVNKMKTINTSVEETANLINKLNYKTAEINQIIIAITKISEKTNLLALNAAIEAARAGESGKGFSVVADEVRKLAEQSAQSSQEIIEIVKDIQTETQVSARFMDSVRAEVAEGTINIEETGKTFLEIVEENESISNQMKQVKEIVENVNYATQNVSTNSNEMIETTRKISDDSHNIAAIASEQATAMKEVEQSIVYLNNILEELQGKVDKFKM